ncbi:MAG TPA: hypothetical protein VHX65_00290 [Pirellulales bacterium]|nr:hypothetical protein [Pirellulales bacterium]
MGIALAVVSIPAALHSVGVAAYRRRKSGVALSVSEKILAFVASFALFLAIAIAIWIAAIGALLVICLSSVAPSGKGAAGTELVVILVAGTGVVFMLSFAFFIVRGLWRAKR